MSKNLNHLSAAVPKTSGGKTSYGGGQSVPAYSELEQRIAELNEQLIKQNRDNEDYRNNVDEDNLSESLLKIIRGLQSNANDMAARISDLENRVTALEENTEENP